MKIKNNLIALLITACALSAHPALAKQIRSEAAKDRFKASHPCPANGNTHGACPGFVIDHIKPLACGGADDPSNMQWQTVAEGKAKDKWERKDCQLKQAANHPAERSYYITPRGACMTYSEIGNKRYVDKRLCGAN